MQANPTPELIEAMKARQAAELSNDPFFERATEEQKNAYREASIALDNFTWSAMQAEIMETLTPEQVQQVRKLEMQLMPALGTPFPSMFEPLDLTGDQKNEMEKITEEMKAEFNSLIEEAAMLKADRIVSVYKSLQEKIFASLEEFDKISSETHSKFALTEERLKKRAGLQERGMKFMTLLQNRLMNVLDDEQLDKMQKIMGESPMFVKQVLAKHKMQQVQQKMMPPQPGWVPGPDSWRPGMPVPVQFKEERRTGRFPRAE
jgi:hypothetical protein